MGCPGERAREGQGVAAGKPERHADICALRVYLRSYACVAALPPDVAPVSAHLRAPAHTGLCAYVDYVDVFSLAWRCEGRPPLPHHFCVCGDDFTAVASSAPARRLVTGVGSGDGESTPQRSNSRTCHLADASLLVPTLAASNLSRREYLNEFRRFRARVIPTGVSTSRHRRSAAPAGGDGGRQRAWRAGSTVGWHGWSAASTRSRPARSP